jgi:glycosyltransferase involved in cell wall biosynthesis
VKWPLISQQQRHESARSRSLALATDGRVCEAEDLAVRTAGKLRDVRLRADLLCSVAEAVLARGAEPALLGDAFAAQLAVADKHVAESRPEEAAEAFGLAMRIALNRSIHFDARSSPLARDPRAFVDPLRRSTSGQALRAPRGRSRSNAARSTSLGRSVRVLIATRRNDNFLQEIRDHLGTSERFESRFFDFAEGDDLLRGLRSPARMAKAILAGESPAVARMEERLRPLLDWADVVFVEWCTALAALLTQVDPRDTRVVVRMHSYEAFTLWPHLMDFSRVDDLVFVSEHLRDLAVAAIPGLQQEDRPRLHVVANAMELQRFVRPKTSDDVRFTLGVIGASKMVKDPRWAIDVVRELRRHDERYRLVLVRGKLQDPSAPAQAYAADLRRDLAELEPSGAVQVLGHTDDVPAVLEGIGVALSSSVRESFHMGLVEAVASGALPVVRDWPFFPGAARELFPADWVVDTPGQAAERILALTQDAEVWRPAAAEASRHVRERWDWPVVRTSFEELFDYRKASG